MKNSSDNKLAFFSVLAAAVIGGGVPVLSKTGLAVFPPFTFTFLRFFIASLALLPLFIKSKPRFTKDIWKVLGLSLLATGNVTLFAFGIKLTTATTGQLLYVSVPVVAAILSYFLLKERLAKKKLLGIFLSLFGALIIIVLPLLGTGAQLHGSFLGNLLILLAMLSFTIYSVFSKRYQKSYTPLQLTTLFAITTAVVLSPFAVQEYASNPAWIAKLGVPSMISILYVAIGGGLVYYTLYQYAIKHGTPTIASMTLLIQPVGTYLWASVLLGEQLTLGIVAGAAITLYGAYLVAIKK